MDKQLLKLTEGVRSWIAGGVLVGWGIVSLNVVQFLLIGLIIDQVFHGESPAWWSFLAFLIIFPARAALTWLARIVRHKAVSQTRLTLRDQLYAHLQKLGPAFVNKARTGSLVNTIVEGVENVGEYVGSYIPQLILVYTVPLLVVAYVALLDWVTALALLAGQALIPLFLIFFRRLFGPVGERFWEAVNTLSAQFLDSIQGLPTLKMFNYSRAYGRNLEEQSDKLRWVTMNRLFISMFSIFFIEWLTTLGTIALAAGMVAWRLEIEALTFGWAIAIVFISVELTRPLLALGTIFQSRREDVAAARQIVNILEIEPRVTEMFQAVAPQTCTPRIQFENVRFAYEPDTDFPEETRLALDSVSFDIQPGETVAIVGPSGAGKTSLINLLLRFYDPDGGTISLSGRKLPTLPLDWLRSQIALASQDTYLFYGSIADNLRLAKPDATQEELEAATRIADIHDFIVSLPSGYQTRIGERGLSLSGGQAQRISIARAMLKDAPVVILDEATAQVDTESETAIQEALDQATKDKTVLMIAHRLYTIRNADRILVLDQGCVVESGTHDTLIQQSGVYARLMAAQRVSATVLEDNQ